MDMNQMAVERDISDFRELVGRLNRRINDAGDLWKDEKYRELRDSISHMVSNSRRIFAQGEQCNSTNNKYRPAITYSISTAASAERFCRPFPVPIRWCYS